MQNMRTFGPDFLRRLFPTVEWDGSEDVNCLLRKQVGGRDGLYLVGLPGDYFSGLQDEEKEVAADVIADLEKHPQGNICAPALPIPFTIGNLKDFLECYQDFYLRLFERDRYFTIKEVASFLKVSGFEIFKKLPITSEGPHLAPSVYFSKSVKVKRVESNGALEEIQGLLAGR